MMATCTPSPRARGSWRADALRIVEELFREAPADSWDLLLDLRQSLVRGTDWKETLDLFLACRLRLEADHYLPFYRLRRLLSASLRLEAVLDSGHREIRPLTQLLQSRHRSLADLERTVRRELFEHAPEPADISSVDLRLVERA